MELDVSGGGCAVGPDDFLNKAVVSLGIEARYTEVLLEVAQRRKVMRGEVLVKEGTEADAFYLVLSGRFTVTTGGRPIAEIGSGEPIGEIAFFGGGTRSASVVAASASIVLELSQEAYDAVLEQHPALSTAILKALAQRLRRTVPHSRQLRPRAAQMIGIVAGGGRALDPGGIDALLSAFRAGGATILTAAEDLGEGRTIADVALDAKAGDRVVALCLDPDAAPDWANSIYQQCDTLLVCLDRRDNGAIPPSDYEARIAEGVLRQNIHLVLLREAGTPISGTAEILTGRDFGLHHHMQRGDEKDAARIARLVEGKGLGVVFGGGGAFGTAHLAILKALGEFGVDIDMVGGTSVGAAMAGAFAMGLSMDEVMDRFTQMFVKSGAATRYTVPIWSIMDHAYFDRQLRHHYGASQMAEDLALNYYAVATSLTRNAPVVLRHGPLWQLIRASSAIPAVFPPMVMEDGEVFVDGALFDNVPVTAMRDLKAGPNLVLSLSSQKDWRVRTDYASLPGRGGAVRRMLGGRRKLRFPTISSIMNRSLIVNSEKLQGSVEREEDIFINLDRIPGMGFMQWSKGRNLFDRTYAETARQLDALAGQHSGIGLLRALATTNGR